LTRLSLDIAGKRWELPIETTRFVTVDFEIRLPSSAGILSNTVKINSAARESERGPARRRDERSG
jgi:hypothetical protein